MRFTPTGKSLADGSFKVEASQDGSSVAAQSGKAVATVSVVAVPIDTEDDNEAVDEKNPDESSDQSDEIVIDDEQEDTASSIPRITTEPLQEQNPQIVQPRSISVATGRQQDRGGSGDGYVVSGFETQTIREEVTADEEKIFISNVFHEFEDLTIETLTNGA